MWQTKYALALPKNLGLGVNFRPCSEGYFLSGHLKSVDNTNLLTWQFGVVNRLPKKWLTKSNSMLQFNIPVVHSTKIFFNHTKWKSEQIIITTLLYFLYDSLESIGKVRLCWFGGKKTLIKFDISMRVKFAKVC